MTYETILVATDGSEPARRATSEAVTLAEAFDASITALYVLEAAEPPPWVDDPEAEPSIDTKAGQALEDVESTAAERGFDGEVRTAVVVGQTGPAIVEFATDRDVDLVVVGTHGRTGIDRLVVGSVAEHVVRHAPMPVVTVKGD